MATAARYGRVGGHLAAAAINYSADTIRVALLGGGYTPDTDTHEFFPDVSGQEVSGDGYTAGGQALAGKSTAYLSAEDRTALRANDTVWDASAGSLTASYAVVYKDTGTAATSPLISYVDFEGSLTATGADFTIDWHDTDGVLKL